MQSCEHKYVDHLEKTHIEGNNFDIISTWEVHVCKHCGHKEKDLLDSTRVEHS